MMLQYYIFFPSVSTASDSSQDLQLRAEMKSECLSQLGQLFERLVKTNYKRGGALRSNCSAGRVTVDMRH